MKYKREILALVVGFVVGGLFIGATSSGSEELPTESGCIDLQLLSLHNELLEIDLGRCLTAINNVTSLCKIGSFSIADKCAQTMIEANCTNKSITEWREGMAFLENYSIPLIHPSVITHRISTEER